MSNIHRSICTFALCLPLLVHCGAHRQQAALPATQPTQTSAVPVVDSFFDPTIDESIASLPLPAIRLNPKSIENWTEKDLFLIGNEAFNAGEWQKAIFYYDRIIRQTNVDQELVPAALYNIALAYGQLNKIDQQIQHLRVLIKTFPRSKLINNAYWKLIDIYDQTQQWTTLTQVIDSFLRQPLDKEEKLELHVRFALANVFIQPALTAIQLLNYHLGRAEKQLDLTNVKWTKLLTRIYPILSQAYLSQAKAVTLEASDLSTTVWEEKLTQKAKWLILAQDAGLKVIPFADATIAINTLSNMAQGYDVFYQELTKSEFVKPQTDQTIQPNVQHIQQIALTMKERAQFLYQRLVDFSVAVKVQLPIVEQAQARLLALAASTSTTLTLPPPQ